MNACYILFSPKLQKFYIGATHDSIENRILKHNQKAYGKHRFTASADDWELFLLIPTTNYAHAIRIERKIKAMKSVKYIQSLKRNPEKIARLVSCT
ncbi:MAG: GIY-YIG nuclease family protein [Paludibacter sp.]|nr:GIY-YIG nuclease family protein [Paludibacter sp.]